ncbi:MAG: hypothetical protein KIT22_12950 [Verrucomicrobiae bacterium]|nr:hypothetical protein [Verrucomicrobiae bacterium]
MKQSRSVRRRYRCLACGYPGLTENPRPKSGGGSFEICPCCGYQFGVDDDDRGVTPSEHRQRWVATGAPWFSRATRPPPRWSARVQLEKAFGKGSKKD